MWTLKELTELSVANSVYIDDQWVPSRPLNYKKQYMSFMQRFHNAWEVFMCRAEAFTWPQGQ